MSFESLRGIGNWALRHPDTMGNVVLALTATGISIDAYDRNRYVSPPPIVSQVRPSTPEISVFDPRKDLLPSVDSAEQTMWLREGYKRPAQPLLITKDNLELIEQRVDTTLGLMRRSKSLELQKAYATFTTMANQGRLSMVPDVRRLSTSQTTKQANITTETIVTPDNQVGFLLHFSAEHILNGSNSPILALEVAHEMRHVADHVAYLQQYARLSAQEQKQKIAEMVANRESYVQEEARGYASQTQVYIDFYHILGRALEDPEHLYEAKLFLAVNGDYTNPRWVEHVDTTYLR